MFQCQGSLPSLRAWHARLTSSSPRSATPAVQHAAAAAASRTIWPEAAGSAAWLRQHQGQRAWGLGSNSRRYRGQRKRNRGVLVDAVGNPPLPPDDDDGFGAGDTQGGAGGGLTPEEASRFGGGRDSVGGIQHAAEAGMAQPPAVPPPPPFRQRTRLAEALLAVPSRTDRYFDDHPGRRWLWLAIAFAAGFYCANTVSLSFGTLAVNDVVAAAVTVGFCEVVSYVYYQAETVTYPLALANAFKMGVIAALISDALKLQG